MKSQVQTAAGPIPAEFSSNKRLPFRSLSLRQLVFLLLLTFAACIIAFVNYSVGQTEKLLLEQEWGELDATADNYERHILTLLDGYRREAALIASRTRLRQLATRHDPENGENHSAGMTRILADARNSSTDIETVSVLDHVGRVIASTDQVPLGAIDMDFHALDGSFRDGSPEETWQTRIEGERVLVRIYTPLRLEGKTVGTLATAFHPSAILNSVRNIDIHHSGEIVLGMVDGDGNLHLLAGIRDRQVTREENSSRPQDLSIPMKMALFGRETRLDGLVQQHSAQRVITVTRHLERIGWGLVASLNREATRGAITPLYTNFLLLAALMIGLAAFAAVFIARRLDEANLAVQQQLLATGNSERRFRSIFDASPSGMLIVRADGRVDMANANAERTLGYASGELVGMAIEELVPEEVRGRHQQDRDQYSRNPVAREMGRGRDLMALRRDGSQMPVEIGLTPLKTDQGTMTIASITDRSEAFQARRALENHTAALQRSNSELDQFAYIASHDLRAPLRGIAQLAQFIEEDAEEGLNEDSKSHLALIRSRTSRLDELLSNLLQYSRIGRSESESGDVDTRQAVTEAAELFLTDHGFKLVIEGELPNIYAPKPLLDLVLRNLLMNAVKHHDLGRGTVTVRAAESDNLCCLEIEDDGPGIPEKYHEKVFEMFQTLKRRDEVEGSGMGLALVQKAMQHINGQVTLISNGDRGTLFRLSFPNP